MEERKPIFYDAHQQRWRLTRRTVEITSGVFTLLLFTFFFSILLKPELPQLLLPETRPALHAVREKRRPKPAPVRRGRRWRVAALGNLPEHYDPLRAAFYVSWDPNSLPSPGNITATSTC
jgi:hypothetical protein